MQCYRQKLIIIRMLMKITGTSSMTSLLRNTSLVDAS